MPSEPLGAVVDFLWEVSALKEYRNHSDGQLLERFVRSGEESAFAVLVHRHGRMVISVCRRVLGDEHQAEDAFQATFLVLARRASSIRRNKPLANWLYGVARRVALKARIKAATSRHRLRELRDMEQTNSLDEATWQELRPILDEEIGQLPDRCRAPIVLCYLEGKSYNEAAKELGCPKSSLASRLERGRELLRHRLVKRGVTLSAGVITVMLSERCVGAAVAMKLTIKTAKAASCFALGKSAAGLVSAQVVTLAEEIMKGIFASKLKLIFAASVLSMALGGAGLAGYHGLVGAGAGNDRKNAAIYLGADAEIPPQQPKVEAKPAIDVHGDPLPAGALARFGNPRFRHDNISYFAEILPDGKRVASAGMDNTLRIWDYTSGKEIRRIALPVKNDTQIVSHALSKDGKVIATAITGVNEIFLREIDTGHDLPSLKMAEARPDATKEKDAEAATNLTYPSASTFGMAFAPEGEVLACYHLDGDVSVWDWNKGKLLKYHKCAAPAMSVSLMGGRSLSLQPYCLAYSLNGKLLAVASHTRVNIQVALWDTSTGAIERTIEISSSKQGVGGSSSDGPRTDAPPPVAFSPDGRTLACVVANDELGAILKKQKRPLPFTAVILEVASGKEIAKLEVTNQPMVFNQDGTKIYFGSEKGVSECDITTGKMLRQLAQDVSASRLFLTSDGKTLVLSGPALGPHSLDVASGKLTAQPAPMHVPLLSVQFSPDGKGLFDQSDSLGQSLQTWNAGNGEHLGQLVFPTETREKLPSFSSDLPLVHLAVSPDGKVLAGCHAFSKVITVVHAANGQLLGHSALSRDDKFWVPTASGISAGKQLVVMKFSSDSRLVAVTARKRDTIDLHDVATMNVIHSWKRIYPESGLDLGTNNIAFSADSKILAVFAGSSSSIELWDTKTGKSIAPLTLPEKSSAIGGAFARDGRLLAVELKDERIAMFELSTGKLRNVLGKQRAEADSQSLELAKILTGLFKPWDPINPNIPPPKGEIGGFGGKLSDEQISQFATTFLYPRPRSRVGLQRVVFSPTHDILAQGTDDNTIRIWDIATSQELAVLKGHVRAVNAVAFSPDGQTLASASDDGTALLWDYGAMNDMW